MRDAWTDERLDDLNQRVDRGFRDLHGEMVDSRRELHGEMVEFRRELHGEMVALRGEMNQRFDTVLHTMVYGFVGIGAAMVAALGAIATQL